MRGGQGCVNFGVSIGLQEKSNMLAGTAGLGFYGIEAF